MTAQKTAQKTGQKTAKPRSRRKIADPATPEEARALLDSLVLEDQLQANILSHARKTGWLAYHTYDSRRSEYGFPDLFLVHPVRAEIIQAELKREAGVISPNQRVWLSALDAIAAKILPAHVFRVFVWRPRDWSSGRIQAILEGSAKRGANLV